MVAEMLAPERDFRGPGCGIGCRTLRALLPGQFGRSELLLHSPEDHEAYGRRLAPFAVAETDLIATGRLTIDMKTFKVAVDGEPVLLTPTEHRLLRTLAQRVGTTVPHQDLLDTTWGGDVAGQRLRLSDMHLVRVVMARLRRKLGTAETLIRTQAGFGYRLELVEVGRTLPPARRNPGWNQRITTWARAWDCCRECGTTEHPHQAKGLCSSCYDRVYP